MQDLSDYNMSRENIIQPECPFPIDINSEAYIYHRGVIPQSAVEALAEGFFVLIDDYYSSGLEVLNALKRYVNQKYSAQSFSEQRSARSVYRELSHRLLLKIANHKLSVRKAPEIGWLKILYSGLSEFLLPFPQVQGLNSSWQWYKKGIYIPVLKEKIHPWYGTYFPTRFEHLELFENWLTQYKGEKKSAYDIGIGSGILSLQMLRHGVSKIWGTDINANAIIGLRKLIKQQQLSDKVELIHGNLFAEVTEASELIVFNPPWIPASCYSEGLDHAIYYDEDLFPRFFSESFQHLVPGGKVVLLFSNIGQITGTQELHPIEFELANEGRFRKKMCTRKKVRAASQKTKRNPSWRSDELVELWELEKIRS